MNKINWDMLIPGLVSIFWYMTLTPEDFERTILLFIFIALLKVANK